MSFHLLKKEDKDNNLTISTVFDGEMGMLYKVVRNIDKYYIEHLSEVDGVLVTTEASLDDSTVTTILQVVAPGSVDGVKKKITTHYEICKLKNVEQVLVDSPVTEILSYQFK